MNRPSFIEQICNLLQYNFQYNQYHFSSRGHQICAYINIFVPIEINLGVFFGSGVNDLMYLSSSVISLCLSSPQSIIF